MEEEKKEQTTEQSSHAEEKTQTIEEKDAKENKMWALLCYLGVLVVIPLLVKKDSKFVEFHTKQGLILLAGWALSILPFGPIIALLVIVLSIIGIINVFSGEMKNLPIVGELAEKIKL
ncbi:MAG: hypothetical protein ACD_9C00294G0002 [uncultured bacterium]|nr:MAG: hypothetical protein ACD_9C00294G0002 [uncultured bacterium]KKQ46304.1 MAG: hypothetical protein US63_C0003G0017 [Candidatus Moranbacteria bacterium GW2011_GWC2_37_8]KKQ63222.1 MAG: hypothetical protein US82_C0002G0017 [Parcubacteria group bacterium GW2011_GWC1_38_22]KKQ79946.1 MAG: hypothetical protein UT03_C0037G0009 [Candidatus Moranbacteria bacterium GW2011_GWD2_38_7]